MVVTQDGALWACGAGDLGRLGLNDEADRLVFERVGAGAFGGARVVAAAAGWQHSAAVTEDGALWTWGNGGDGRRATAMRAPFGADGGVGGGARGGRIGRCRGCRRGTQRLRWARTGGWAGAGRADGVIGGHGCFAQA